MTKFDLWGFLPSFLDPNNPKTTIEQLNDGQPGGWCKFDGFTYDANTHILSYPGDPPMHMLDTMKFKNDIIELYPHSWVLVRNEDGTKWEAARCD